MKTENEGEEEEPKILPCCFESQNYVGTESYGPASYS
jgi:hypothetical protein